PEAVEDLTRSLETGTIYSSVYFLRAGVRARLGDKEGARQDREKGLTLTPTDETGWIDRGLDRRQTDPRGALADFEQALKINPRSFDGLQNRAAILVDKFDRAEEALQTLEEAVKHYPDSVLARAGRGVLLARTGRRAAAVADAQQALLLDTEPPTLYQVAC